MEKTDEELAIEKAIEDVYKPCEVLAESDELLTYSDLTRHVLNEAFVEVTMTFLREKMPEMGFKAEPIAGKMYWPVKYA
jgi:hypothetical protein